jgi:cupin 2 domain-containing protein
MEGETDICAMHPGDYIHIPAHQRYRVEWTDAKQKTVWLALHYDYNLIPSPATGEGKGD